MPPLFKDFIFLSWKLNNSVLVRKCQDTIQLIIILINGHIISGSNLNQSTNQISFESLMDAEEKKGKPISRHDVVLRSTQHHQSYSYLLVRGPKEKRFAERWRRKRKSPSNDVTFALVSVRNFATSSTATFFQSSIDVGGRWWERSKVIFEERGSSHHDPYYVFLN